MVLGTDAFNILNVDVFIKFTSIYSVLYMVNLHTMESKFCKTVLGYRITGFLDFVHRMDSK
jgi:hypothetical protein